MTKSKPRSLAAVGGLMVAGAVLAGCGGGSGSGHAGDLANASGTVPVTTGTVPAATTTAPANSAPAATADAGSTSPAKCTTGNLSITLTGTQGAAGSTISDLVFTNRGSAPCTMTGYPGVSLVASPNGTQVGEAGARSAGTPVRTITVQPGKAATAKLRQAQAGNFPASACHPISTRGFRVYPPNNTAAAFVASPGRGCANASLGQPQLFVTPVTTGTVPAATTTAAANSAPAATADAGSTSPAKCTTGNLSITLTGTQGAAGSTISDLVFTNRGSAPCTMTGYPGVSLVASPNGTQVGEAGARSAGTPVRTITVQPGKAATAKLRQAQAGNFPASACHPISTRGFRVYPPNNTAAAFVASPGRGCANASLGQPQLFVTPVTTGTVPAATTTTPANSAPAATAPPTSGSSSRS